MGAIDIGDLVVV